MSTHTHLVNCGVKKLKGGYLLEQRFRRGRRTPVARGSAKRGRRPRAGTAVLRGTRRPSTWGDPGVPAEATRLPFSRSRASFLSVRPPTSKRRCRAASRIRWQSSYGARRACPKPWPTNPSTRIWTLVKMIDLYVIDNAIKRFITNTSAEERLHLGAQFHGRSAVYAGHVDHVGQVRHRVRNRVVIVLQGQRHLGHQISNVRYLVACNQKLVGLIWYSWALSKI